MVVADFYTGEHYLKKNPDWHSNEASWRVQAILRSLHKHQIQPQTICDIGCGAGEVLRLFQQRLPPTSELIGYDIAPYAIELAKTRENDRLHFKLADFFTEEEASFDLILLIGVLEHFENCFQVLRDLKDRSTYKLFLLPMDITVTGILRNQQVKSRQEAGHLHFFTKDVMLEILKDQGYQVIDVCYVHQPLDTTPWSAVASHPLKFLKKIVKVTLLGLKEVPASVLFRFDQDLATRIFGCWRLLILAN